jgi:hypothetical protein
VVGDAYRGDDCADTTRALHQGQITFIQFMKRLLQTYREMRRLNHLIKGLFYLQYLVIDRDKGVAAGKP